VNRRDFLAATGAAAGGALVSSAADAKAPVQAAPAKKPNIILYLSDQFRWDFLGANNANGSTQTPNLDAMARRGNNFTHAVTNQPVCAPARSVVFTSRYATETGVWHNGEALRQDLPTLAGELRKAGYTANLIGKWHLGLGKAQGGGPGFVPPEYRGGFLDLCGKGPTLLKTHRILITGLSGMAPATKSSIKIGIASTSSRIVQKISSARNMTSHSSFSFRSSSRITRTIWDVSSAPRA